MAEIDDAALERLTKSQALLDELLRSPKTKRKTERAIKELHPETVISDDYDSDRDAKIDALAKKFDTFLDVQSTREQDTELNRAFDQLRGADWGYSDDGIDKIKKIMVERKIPDPLAAAAYYEKMNPPPKPQQPSGFGGTSWGFGAKSDDADVKLLFEDEDAWAEKQAHAHFNEQAKS